jgi:ATP-binding cassette subfamily F protein uup
VFEGGGRIKDFNGHYYEWREEQKRIDAIRVAQEKAAVSAVEEAPKEKVKLSFKERAEWEALPEEISVLEAERDALNAVFESTDQDPDAVARAAAEIKVVLAALDNKEMRWLELAEFADE